VGYDAGCGNSCKKCNMWKDTVCRCAAARSVTYHHRMYAQGQPSAALLLQDLPSPEGSHPARYHIAYVDVKTYCTAATQARLLYVTSDCESFTLCCFIACACHRLIQLMMCKHMYQATFKMPKCNVMRMQCQKDPTSCSDACHIGHWCLLCMQASKSLS